MFLDKKTKVRRGKMDVIRTGIPKLDDKLGGGVRKGKSICYYVEPGVAGEIFGMQTLAGILEAGGRGVLVTTTKYPSVVREQFKEYGWDLAGYGDRFAIIDAFSGLMGLASCEKYVVEDPGDMEGLSDAITHAMEDLSPGDVIYSSLSQIMDACGEYIEEYVKKWNKLISLKGLVGVYGFTAWPYPEEILAKVREEFFDCVVQLGGIGNGVHVGRYYEVVKVDWGDVSDKHILFWTVKPGGLKAYELSLRRESLEPLIEAIG